METNTTTQIQCFSASTNVEVDNQNYKISGLAFNASDGLWISCVTRFLPFEVKTQFAIMNSPVLFRMPEFYTAREPHPAYMRVLKNEYDDMLKYRISSDPAIIRISPWMHHVIWLNFPKMHTLETYLLPSDVSLHGDNDLIAPHPTVTYKIGTVRFQVDDEMDDEYWAELVTKEIGTELHE